MVTNTKEYMNTYMNNYIKNSPVINCECGLQYKAYNKYKHMKSHRHARGINKVEVKKEENELIKRIMELERKVVELTAK